MNRASKLSQNDTGGEVHGNQQLVQEPKSPSHNCCPLAKAHQQRLFRYSRSLPRPLLEYQKLASHHPRRFADWISAFLNLLRHGHFREYTKSCMWGTRPVSFHFAWRVKIFEIHGCGAQNVETICVRFTLKNYVDLLGLLGFRPFYSF